MTHFVFRFRRVLSYIITESDLHLRSENDLKSLFNEKLNQVPYNYLISKAREHSKVNDAMYKDMSGCKYLNDKRFTPDLVNLLFAFQTRCFELKHNFRNKYANENLKCEISGCEEPELPNHIFTCQPILREYGKPLNCQYEDIFSEDCDKILTVGKTIKYLVQIRKRLLEPTHD